MRWTVGVDFGGTLVKVGLVDERGRISALKLLDTGAARGPDAFIGRLVDAIRSLAASRGLRLQQLRGIGLGAPGLVDIRRGIVRRMVNVPDWRNVHLQAALQRALHCPRRVDNDANLAALGEWRFGAGRGSAQMVAVTLGTGVGGGLVLNGALYRGAAGSAGEIGHMVIDPGGPRCGCGRLGCLEAHVGTAGILRQARAAIRGHRGPLSRLAAEAGGRLTPRLVSQAAQAGDVSARAVWAQAGEWLGRGLANAANLLNPDRIVIGGGVSGAWRWFAPSMKQAMNAHLVFTAAPRPRVVRASLGARAGVVGAAVLLWMELERGRSV